MFFDIYKFLKKRKSNKKFEKLLLQKKKLIYIFKFNYCLKNLEIILNILIKFQKQ